MDEVLVYLRGNRNLIASGLGSTSLAFYGLMHRLNGGFVVFTSESMHTWLIHALHFEESSLPGSQLPEFGLMSLSYKGGGMILTDDCWCSAGSHTRCLGCLADMQHTGNDRR